MPYLKLGLAGFIGCALWSAMAVYGGLSGWWMTPAAPAGDTPAFQAVARRMIDEAGFGDVAYALIEDGVVRDEHYRSESGEVGADTLFPTASFSKWPTAYGVHLLAQAGKLELDAPVSRYLQRWQLPTDGFDTEGVTVRRLLSHTAGLVDGLGFGDYDASEEVPDLEASLSDPRGSGAERPRIVVGEDPGSAWRYSGGSYLLLELLVEEVSGQRFAEYMQEAVFAPLGMERSTYAYLGDQEGISGSFHEDGRPAPLFRYAAKGATGLSSTASDLARFALAHLAMDAPLGPEALGELIEPLGFVFGAPIWGAGAMLYAPAGEQAHVFGHDGSNDPSINSSVRINPTNGDAIVVLSTGPAFLASRLGYEWVLWQTGYPDFLQTDRALASAMRPLMIGVGLIIALTVLLMVRSRRASSS